MLRILHSADLHIGMSFNNYPEEVGQELQQARLDSLDQLVEKAQIHECELLVIAGDLFHSTRISKKMITQVHEKLNAFTGDCIAILPGNHDYDDGINALWSAFLEESSDKILVMNEYRPYPLQINERRVVLYPAFCDSRHSEKHRLSWITENPAVDFESVHIGLAHGSIEGLSPDFHKKYFPMRMAELEDLPMDLWLLGHTHVPYPDPSQQHFSRIFIAGTPEPDGLDFKGEGNAWLISIDQDKQLQAEAIRMGQYIFIDQAYKVDSEKDLHAIRDSLGPDLSRVVARIKLQGYVDEQLRDQVLLLEQELKAQLFYLAAFDCRDLRMLVNEDYIKREYARDGFAYRLLMKLADDPRALQMAYELVEEAKK
ncbi:MAG TPA: DNA repair exonuclease [Syntrophomonadaceae bacterium]|nr:DNA repair exonuclease [Syntrophomonadaceae bacterium]